MLLCLSYHQAGGSTLAFLRQSFGLGVLPSEETIREHIKQVIGAPLRECGFTDGRFDAALPFFNKVGYTSRVFLLVNDATALLPALGYRASDDSVHGYAISDELLSLIDVRAGESLDEFRKRFHSMELANQVELIILAPLAARCPPYILAAFAQSGSQSAETISQRLTIARDEMERRGALIIGWAADGASAHFKLMRQMRQLTPGTPKVKLCGIPTLLADQSTVWLPARIATYNGEALRVPVMPLLDPVHHLALLRNAPLRTNAALKVGAFDISLSKVRDLLAAQLGAFEMEARLGVRYTDFDVTDRMNFASAQRLFSTKLLTYLEQHCIEQQHRGSIFIALIALFFLLY